MIFIILIDGRRKKQKRETCEVGRGEAERNREIQGHLPKNWLTQNSLQSQPSVRCNTFHNSGLKLNGLGKREKCWGISNRIKFKQSAAK